MTSEHVWPGWVSKILPTTRYINQRTEGTVKSKWTTARIDQTANVVCKTCNETWMSNLENWARDRLIPVIRDGKTTIFTAEDMSLLSAYELKHAVIANYQSLRVMPEPIFTRSQRERFRESLAVPSDVRIWISAFQGKARFSGRSNPRYARSTVDPPPLDDLDVYSHTYVVGHLVFQLLASRWNSISNRDKRVELPKQDPYWNPASQQISPAEQDSITWPQKYLGEQTIEAFVDRWTGPVPITIVKVTVGKAPQ